MAHTLRRSKSKYGKTRRQRRKQKRVQGGGIFQDFVNKFKPSTPEEKCDKARKDAEEVCNSITEEIPPLEPSVDSVPVSVPESSNITSASDMSMSQTLTAPQSTPAASESIMIPPTSQTMPVMQNSETGLSPNVESVPQPQLEGAIPDGELSLSPAPSIPNNTLPLTQQKYNGSGGAKSKRRNKKQHRRKKTKSKKYKK